MTETSFFLMTLSSETVMLLSHTGMDRADASPDSEHAYRKGTLRYEY